jgi:hypothetical protein
MIFVTTALAGAKVSKIMDELDCRNPFHYLESKFIFAAQPCPMQHADSHLAAATSRSGESGRPRG